jgi:Protein of unknown function (DUF1579)
MRKIEPAAALALVCLTTVPALAQQAPDKAEASSVPAWVQRGAKGAGQTAMAPLVGTWNVEVGIYGTIGRSPDLPPIMARNLRATRSWVADGHYIEETIEGTVGGAPYWRRGWLGYSNMDQRFEWITVAPLVPMMFFRSAPGSGAKMPVELTGTFTDQGIVNETTVGKPIGMRTLIRIEGPDRHVSELYFTPPDGKEQLAMRMQFTRMWPGR